MPVVSSESPAATESRKTRPNSGSAPASSLDAAPAFDLSFSSDAPERAGVRELFPTSTATRPETPPTAASSFGNCSSTSGPKMTVPLSTTQTIEAMSSHAPKRAHHSRSSSLTFGFQLVSPTKIVTPVQKTSRKKGTARQMYSSVVQFHQCQEVQSVHASGALVTAQSSGPLPSPTLRAPMP